MRQRKSVALRLFVSAVPFLQLILDGYRMLRNKSL